MAHCSDIEHHLDTAEAPKVASDTDVYEGYVPPEQELSDLERRAYAMAVKAAKVAVEAEHADTPPADPDGTFASMLAEHEDPYASLGGGLTDHRSATEDYARDARSSRPAISAPAPAQPAPRPGYKTAAQRNARAHEAQARRQRWGR